MLPLRVLGIDPGIARLGYGIVDVSGNQLHAVTYGCLETPAHTPVSARLHTLYRGISEIIQTYQPQVMAVEELFFNRNTTTAFVVGQARGVVLLAGVEHGMTDAEYTPMQVKQAVVGYGKAEKSQIQYMVRLLLNLREVPKPDDTADALAVAITHAHFAPVTQLTNGNPVDSIKSQRRDYPARIRESRKRP